MREATKFYIDGAWVEPAVPDLHELVGPATGTPVGRVAFGRPADVDRAVTAAARAFEAYSVTSRAARLELLDRIIDIYIRRSGEIAEAMSVEMGAPLAFARRAQVGAGLGHLKTARRLLDSWAFGEDRGSLQLRYEPVGVCGLITPWNWPMNQVACKVAPALAVGCTMVLKPSELSPLSASLFAEVLHEAGVPPGVFNLVHGEGPVVGEALAGHPRVDMVSFTGSTRGGIAVANAAAPTVKRVHQELGGKSPLLVLDAAVLEAAIGWAVRDAFGNSGQSCNAPTRLLVPRALEARAAEVAAAAAAALVVGDPADPRTDLGPVVSRTQYERIQSLIRAGMEEGARPVCGGEGRPEGLSGGWYVRPTVFAGVRNDMRIAQEEIFGPVVTIIPHDGEEDAVRIANDTRYGLAAYVWATELPQARRVATRLRAGMVHLNGASLPLTAPFGGYRQSGNGREWGEFGLREYLEVKAVPGWGGE